MDLLHLFCLLKGLSAHTHVELPYYSKFLLIAAYLASYNPARTDKRFFLKVKEYNNNTFFMFSHVYTVMQKNSYNEVSTSTKFAVSQKFFFSLFLAVWC